MRRVLPTRLPASPTVLACAASSPQVAVRGEVEARGRSSADDLLQQHVLLRVRVQTRA